MDNKWPSTLQQVTLNNLNNLTRPHDFPSDQMFQSCADELKVDVNMLKAFADVESGHWGGFRNLTEGGIDNLTILYERHVFHRLTQGKYDTVSRVNIKGRVYTLSSAIAGGYGPVSIQHEKRKLAGGLGNREDLKYYGHSLVFDYHGTKHPVTECADMACSWGLFQIMGYHYTRLGFKTIYEFIQFLFADIDNHLITLQRFIQTDDKLLLAIQNRQFKVIAETYNGKNQKGYDNHLKEAYLVRSGAHL